MFVVSLLLWVIAVMLLISNPKHDYARWSSALAFFSGLGGVSVFFDENLYPLIVRSVDSNSFINAFYTFTSILSILSHYLPPYTLFMFSISYSKPLLIEKNEFIKKYKAYILLIPVLTMIALYPLDAFITSNSTKLYKVSMIWVVPYIIVSNLLLLYSYVKEVRAYVKRQKLLAFLLVAPSTILWAVTSIVLPAFKNEFAWRYNTWIMVFVAVLFAFFAVRHGVLGVRLRLEKNNIDSTIKAVSTGTAILNHTIKNELSIIALCVENIRAHSKESDNYINKNVSTVLKSVSHMRTMVEKIQENIQDIVIYPQECSLPSIVNCSLSSTAPILDNKNIKIVNRCDQNIPVCCDKDHICEVLNNIIKNAVEAMDEKGSIEIDSSIKRGQAVLAIKDSGKGIPKESLAYVFNPFFSTKKNNSNFGLGLSYCYNVMQKHKGLIEIQSVEGHGTTVLLYFPVNKGIPTMPSYDRVVS